MPWLHSHIVYEHYRLPCVTFARHLFVFYFLCPLGSGQGFEVHPLIRSIGDSAIVSAPGSAEQHQPGLSAAQGLSPIYLSIADANSLLWLKPPLPSPPPQIVGWLVGVLLLPAVLKVDVEAPDLSKFADFAKATYVECILEPGDMLYIPPRYWHYVRSLEISLSVSFWWT